MHLYCDCCTWLQAKLYNGELISSMSCVMVSVMLLVRILLSTLHSINLWTCFTEISFLLGTSEVPKQKLSSVNLWTCFCLGSWYAQFASPFYIIIYLYS